MRSGPRWPVAVVAALTLAAAACGGDDDSNGVAVSSPSTPEAQGASQPATAWTEVAASPLSPRSRSTTVWTGDEMLVVGGDTFMCPPGADCAAPDAPPLSDGAAYDPARDEWRTISDAPVGFPFASTAVVGDDVYFAVPSDMWTTSNHDFLRYSVADDAWTRLPPPPGGARWYQLVAAGDVVIAHTGSHEQDAARDFVFDPAADAWTALPVDPLAPAFDRVMTWSGGHVYLFGRALVPNPGSEVPSLVRAARLDLATGVWEPLPDSEILASGPWLVDGSRLVNPTLGSADGGEVNNWGRSYPYGGVFDTATLTWSALPEVPDALTGAGALGTNDALYLATSGPLLDVAAAAWIDVPALDTEFTERAVASAGADAFVFGGVRWPEQAKGELLGDAWIWRSGRGAGAAPTAPSSTASIGTSAAPAALVLSRSGGCGDAFFWAATADETFAVTVTVDASARSATEPTTIDFAVPDPDVEVEIQTGSALTQPFCNDVIDGNVYERVSTTPATGGTGRITLDPGPRGACGAHGTLHLEGLTTDDGMRVEPVDVWPVDVATDTIGCYAG
jgi:hypothetical protein